MFLEYSKPAVRTILELFTDPANYPIHIYCTLGKDRTGCIVALVLWCCGATREEIVHDYQRSRHVVISGPQLEALERSGLRQAMLESPAEVMANLLDRLTADYGSPTLYLHRAGFGRRKQLALRRAMMGESPLPSFLPSLGESYGRPLSPGSPIQESGLQSVHMSMPDFHEEHPLDKEIRQLK
jgi:hypothetical protein